nr:membrane dipeptidase [Fredinandcohnia onubensis]
MTIAIFSKKELAILQLFDLHSDIFTDIAIRRERGEKKVFDRIHFPRLKQGGVVAILCVIWVEPSYRGNELQRFHSILAHVMHDLSECEHVAISSFGATEKLKSQPSDKITVYLGLEGLTFMGNWDGSTSFERVKHSINKLDKLDFQHAIFAWNEKNFLATGTGCHERFQNDGLTAEGKFAVHILEKSNWLIDVSHLNEHSFWQVLQTSESPLLASHSNARKLCDVDRNLTDEQIKAIVSTGGIIGLNAYGGFVDEQKPTISRFVDHMVYMAELVGIDCISFGFDFMDYLEGYELDGPPILLTEGLEDVTMIPYLIDTMITRGFTSKEIEAVSFDNAVNFLQRVYQ